MLRFVIYCKLLSIKVYKYLVFVSLTLDYKQWYTSACRNTVRFSGL